MTRIVLATVLVAMAVLEMGQPSHGEAGDMLDMSKSLVSQRAAGLLAKGYAVQHRGAPNRRQARLELTPAGHEALEEIYQELADKASAIFDVLGTSSRNSCSCSASCER